MDEYVAQVSQALKGAALGDSNQLQLLEQLKENVVEYCNSLLYIIKNDDSLIKNALLELTRTIEQNLQNFPPEFIQFLCSEFMQLYNGLNDPDHLRYLVSTFFKLYEIQGPNWQEFSTVFEPNAQKMPFQIELLRHLFNSFKKFGPMILENAEHFSQFLLFGLQEGSWDIKLKCIGMTSILAAIDSDSLAPHIQLIFAMIQQSTQYDEQKFMSLWTEFSAFIETIELSAEQNQVAFQAAFESLQSQQLSLESKSLALTTINSLPFPDQEAAILVLDNAFTISAMKGENGEFLESIGDLFGRSIDNFGPQPIYDFLKQKLMEAVSAPNFIAIGVSLYIISEVVEKLVSQIREDWPMFHQVIENAPSSEDEFLYESCLIFISKLNEDFEKQILESNLFADFIIPLITHPSPGIHHQALEAMFQMLDSISCPVPEISEKLWSIQPNITTDENRYLTLFAKAIEKEGKYFASENAPQISEVIIQLFQSENDDLVLGALSVATALLLLNEDIYPLILEPTIQTIQACILSDSIQRQMYGLLRMNHLFPVFKEHFSPDSFQKIMELLGNSKNHHVVENAATCIAQLAKEMNQDELTNQIIPIYKEWIENQDGDYFDIALASIMTLAPILKDELLVEIETNIIQLSIQTKNEEYISSCFDFLAAIITKLDGKPCLQHIVEQTTELALNFIQGKFAICENKTPLECQIQTVKSFANLISELFHFQTEANRQFFEFLQLFVKDDDDNYIDIAMDIFGDGVLYDAFNAQEKAFVYAFLINIAKPDTNVDLIQSITYAMFCLVQKDLLNAQNIQHLFPVIVQWWNDLNATSRNTMISTLTNIAILFWAIALKCGPDFIVPKIFAQTFDFFPSDSKDDMNYMCSMLMEMAKLEFPFPAQIALAISNLLVLPKMMIYKYGVTDEMIVSLGQVLNALYNGNSDAHTVIGELVKNSAIWQNRIGQILAS